MIYQIQVLALVEIQVSDPIENNEEAKFLAKRANANNVDIQEVQAIRLIQGTRLMELE